MYQLTEGDTYQGEFRDSDEDADGSAEPHDGHNGQQTHGHLIPSISLILGRELEAGNDQLHANDNTADSQGDGKLLLGGHVRPS